MGGSHVVALAPAKEAPEEECATREPRPRSGGPPSQEQPVVVPQVTHLRQVPLRTRVMCPQLEQESPS